MTSSVPALRAATILGLTALAGLSTAPGALAKPDEGPRHAVSYTGNPVSVGPELRAGAVDSLPAGARPGGRYVVHGRVVNLGTRTARGPVVLRLLRRGTSAPRVGRAVSGAAPRRMTAFTAQVTLPRHLRGGRYQLAACTLLGGTKGPQSCVIARHELVVGSVAPLRGPLAVAAAPRAAPGCSPGARTLADASDVRLYPEVGNGGYKSVHTDVNLVYNTADRMFLPGTNVRLEQLATQCLTEFSLDFEHVSADTTNGPDMAVGAVSIDGVPATFAYKQPTYAGDPKGADDPDPLAHRSGSQYAVGDGNGKPPACTPADDTNALNDKPCPTTKLVITPAAEIPAGKTFTVEVDYTGRPGIHAGGGQTEGWFDAGSAPNYTGSFVTTEPVGTMAWMPLNDFPTAKPTYTFTQRMPAGKVGVANGDLMGITTDPTDPQFPGKGSTTYTWHSPEPIQNYLIESSIGDYDLIVPTSKTNGIAFYEAQDKSISASDQASNKTIIDKQPDITAFEAEFNGPFPFDSDGVIVGAPTASFEEEMQTKITFEGGSVGESTLYHENMHQWWGDSVAESRIRETFFKEGFATLAEYLFTARQAAEHLGAEGLTPYDTAFDASLTGSFNEEYNLPINFTTASSDETAGQQFGSATYARAGDAYLALRAVLGAEDFVKAMKKIQADYKFGNLSEPEEIAEFYGFLPQTTACRSMLQQFFTQWFDTPYMTGSGLNRPQLTGMTGAGESFFSSGTTCGDATAPVTVATPAAQEYAAAPSITLTATDASSTVRGTFYSVDGGTETMYTQPFSVSGEGRHFVKFYSVGVNGNVEQTETKIVDIDTIAPVTTASAAPLITGGGGSVDAPATVTLEAEDATSGVAKTVYTLDGGPEMTYTEPFTVADEGMHTVVFHSTDVAGNAEAAKTFTFEEATGPTGPSGATGSSGPSGPSGPTDTTTTTSTTPTTSTTTTTTPPPSTTAPADTTPAPTTPADSTTTTTVSTTLTTSTTTTTTTAPPPTFQKALKKIIVKRVRLIGGKLSVRLFNRNGVTIRGKVTIKLGGHELGTFSYHVGAHKTTAVRVKESTANQLRVKRIGKQKLALHLSGKATTGALKTRTLAAKVG